MAGNPTRILSNPDFRLQVIDLNPNSVIDEADVAQIADINLTASLFEIDVTQVAARLKQQPGIADASAERHLPGKLVVRVTPRIPKAWLFHMDSDASAVRKVGAMLVDQTGIAYPCPEMQLTSALSLPIIYLPLSEQVQIAAGQKISLPELYHCFRLLDSAIEADPESIQWIESIKQINQWSLELATRQGTKATFGLGDHDRQMHSFRAAIDHASQKATPSIRSTSFQSIISQSPSAMKFQLHGGLPLRILALNQPEKTAVLAISILFSIVIDLFNHLTIHGTSRKNSCRTRNRHQQNLHGRR